MLYQLLEISGTSTGVFTPCLVKIAASLARASATLSMPEPNTRSIHQVRACDHRGLLLA